MKKFLLLLHEDRETMNNFSPKEMEELINAHMAWAKKLSEEGTMLAGEPLQDESKFIRTKEAIVKDGYYLESKELIGGFYLLQAKDMEAALEIAKACPCHLFAGTTEVRPVAEM